MKKIRQQNKCKVCGKNISSWNKSGFCSYHYLKWYRTSERGKAKRKEWRVKNPEKVKKWQLQYYKNNKKHLKEYSSKYYRKKKEERKKYAKEYYQKKKENVTPRE